MNKQETIESMMDELTQRECPNCDETGHESDPWEFTPIQLLSHEGKLMLMERRIKVKQDLINKYKNLIKWEQLSG